MLDNIDNLFSKIYNNIYFDKFLVYIKSNKLLRTVLRGRFTMVLLIKIARFVSNFESLKIKDIIYTFIINIRLINKILREYINKIILIPNNKEYISKLIKIISMLKFINNKYGITLFIYTANLENLNNIKISYFNSLQTIFIENNFYNEQTFINILSLLRDKIHNLNMNSNVNPPVFIDRLFYDDPKDKPLFNYRHDYVDPTNYKCYKLRNNNSNISVKQLSIVSRDNVAFIKHINENNIYINTLPNNFHYISFNSSISMSANYNNINTTFDLLRTKFNICISDIFIKKYLPNTWTTQELNIPSEFIDVSITDSSDTSYEHYIHAHNKVSLRLTVPLNNPIIDTFEVESYNLLYIIDDLNNMLWNQHFCPWIDPKYGKRISRLLFLFGVQNKARNLLIINNLYWLISDIVNYIDNGRQYGDLINLLQLLKFNNPLTYINDFVRKMNDIHNKGMSYSKYILYNETYRRN